MRDKDRRHDKGGHAQATLPLAVRRSTLLNTSSGSVNDVRWSLVKGCVMMVTMCM